MYIYIYVYIYIYIYIQPSLVATSTETINNKTFPVTTETIKKKTNDGHHKYKYTLDDVDDGNHKHMSWWVPRRTKHMYVYVCIYIYIYIYI